MSGVRYRVVTPTRAPGAVAIVQLEGDVDAALGMLGLAPVGVGGVGVRELCGVDRGVVARWSESCCQLMPHGGRGVVRLLAAELEKRGIAGATAADPGAMFPEAGSPLEAAMLYVLSRAASPAAVGVLLEQVSRFASGAPGDAALDRTLNRLVVPATVVALGRANVGKSTLVNALAGRAVAVVGDEPGTTRDHVGVHLNVGGPGGGVVVRYVDTPGLREGADGIERGARALAIEVARRADLIVLIGDASGHPPEPPPGVGTFRVATRTDLGEPCFDADVRVCAPRGEGIEELRAAIRERLIPGACIENRSAWRFWTALDLPPP